MKILLNAQLLVLYTFANDQDVRVLEDRVDVDNGDLHIGDLNNTNATLIENVDDVPADFQAGHYTYENGKWVKNLDLPAPATVTLRQLKLALLANGDHDTIDTHIGTASEELKIEWASRQENVGLTSPLADEIRSKLSLSDREMADLFTQAESL